jgi:hypothetical protein
LNIHPFIERNGLVKEKHVGHDLKLFSKTNNTNFAGYWQYYDYYEQIMPVLQAEFQLKPDVLTEGFLKVKEQISNTQSVSVHVRRGDYQLHRAGAFRDLPVRYYLDAISMIEGDLFIFSDDIPWCKEVFDKEYFPNRELAFVDMEDFLCLELIRLCAHNVITNSTFSWWGAMLNSNVNKKVVCPQHFPGVSIEESEQYRYPKEWVKIKDYDSAYKD